MMKQAPCQSAEPINSIGYGPHPRVLVTRFVTEVTRGVQPCPGGTTTQACESDFNELQICRARFSVPPLVCNRKRFPPEVFVDTTLEDSPPNRAGYSFCNSAQRLCAASGPDLNAPSCTP